MGVRRAWVIPALAVVAGAWGFWDVLRAALKAAHEDLVVYLLAVRAVAAGSPLYEVRAPNGDPFLYPPFAAVIMWPVSWVSEKWARGMWTFGTMLLLLAMIMVMAARRPMRDAWEYLVLVPVGFVVLLLSSPAWLNLELGQVTALIVVLVMVDALEVTPARLRGIPLGVAVAIKLTPAVFLLYFLVAGRTRDGLRALAAFATCSVIGAILLPHDSATFWTGALFRMESRLGYLNYVDNQSANAMLLRWGVPTPAITVVWFAIAATVSVAAIMQARKLRQRGQEVYGILIIGCATLVASPISWGHHLFWVVLAGIWLLWSPRPELIMAGLGVLATMLIGPDLGLAPDAQDGLIGMVRVNYRGLASLVLACGGLWWAAKLGGQRPTGHPVVLGSVNT